MPIVATDNSRSYDADRAEVRRAMEILFGRGERRELRSLPTRRSRVVNSDQLEQAVDTAVALADENVYWCLNPIQEGAARANAKTVLFRSWYLVDIDSIRPKDLSATEEEKERAGEVSQAIVSHLVYERGWPAPIIVDSGNGWHLLFKVKLPNDKLSHQILRDVTHWLAKKFDTPFATVDKATHDAPRISKLPGTTAKKGPNLPDRPHRVSRIVFVPDSLDIVSVEQLRELAGPIAAERPPRIMASDGGGLAGYVSRAIEGECGKVALSTQGCRNNALNAAAFALGTMAGWPEMDEKHARGSLARVATSNGLSDREIASTIESGWTAGKGQPRKKPESQAIAEKPKLPEGARLCVRASEIRPRVVEWLWPNRVAVGFITLFAGRTGVGKSFVLCDFIARITTGRALPDAQNGKPPANVLLISEDPYDYVLAPRLKEMNADLERVSFFTWEAMAAYTLADVTMLERAFEEADSPLLIAIDPPANFLGGKADEHKNSEVRQVLMNIVAWLNTKSVACVMITHVNKQVGKGVEAVDRIMGSVAWASTSRIALGFAPDPGDKSRCLFAGIKNNLGPKATTLAYEIKKTETLAIIEWHGEVETSADEAFNNTVKMSVSKSIETWMEERFREKRSWLSNEIWTMAKHAGFSENAIKTYTKGVTKRQIFDENNTGTWWWEAVPGWPEENRPESAESAESVDVSHCGTTADALSDKWVCHPKEVGALSALSGVSGLSDVASDTEYVSSLKWLASMLGKEPVQAAAVFQLGERFKIDRATMSKVSHALRVVRTFENGEEFWSIP